LETSCENLREGSEISGGESQRIGVAKAIIRKLQFIIQLVDEASSDLAQKLKVRCKET